MQPADQKKKQLDQQLDNNEEMFGTLKHLMDIDVKLNPSEYVNRVIKYAETQFKQDRGRKDTKRANLGDIRSTSIQTPEILQKPIYNCSEEQKAVTFVSGNIKAMVPLFREKLSCDDTGLNLVHFKRGSLEPIQEKRIFGILTAN